MYTWFFVIAILLFHMDAMAQLPIEKALTDRLALVDTEGEKNAALADLASFYSLYRSDRKADSVLQLQLSLAEVSNNEDLITQAFFSSSLENIQSWSSKETFDRALLFIQKGLNYAKEEGLQKLELLAHLTTANLLRKRNSPDDAIFELSKTFSLLRDNKDDSLEVVFYLSLGDCFLSKGDPVAAYTNYNRGYDIAYGKRNYKSLSACLHRFADLYKSLGDREQAKIKLLESAEMNIHHRNQFSLVEDYYDLTRLTDEVAYLQKGMRLADSIQATRLQLRGKIIYLSYLFVLEKDSKKALDYLNRNQDLLYYYNNQGILTYHIASIYFYGSRFDSAVHYYQLAEPTITHGYETAVQYAFFMELAKGYAGLKQNSKSIEYAQKAFALAKPAATADVNAEITLLLSTLYAAEKDYKNAYEYNQLYLDYTKTLNQSANQRKMFLLAVDRESKKREKDLEDITKEERRRRDLQYTGISMATAFLFIVLLVFGMFPISKTTIRMLNFFSFICLFEFIILLIDTWLHHLTHGAPLYIWLAKILIIALLLPLHHTLEHVAVKFLSSQKLMRFRQRISFKKLFHPSKKNLKKIEKKMEESTLI